MQIELPDAVIGEIAERVKRKLEAEAQGRVEATDAVASEYQLKLLRIWAKENISIQDAPLLLNCSNGHIRNLVNEARKGKATHPPFLNKDGVSVLPREAFGVGGEATS